MRASVLVAFDVFPGFLRESGLRIRGRFSVWWPRALRPRNLDLILLAPVSGCPLASLLPEEYTKMFFFLIISVFCLVRQWIHGHASVYGAFGVLPACCSHLFGVCLARGVQEK